MMPIDLITLSREYGAGASLLAKALGAHLGWHVLDDDLPRRVAARLGLPSDALLGRDEHSAGAFERAGRAFVLGDPQLLVSAEVAAQPDPGVVARATREILLEAVTSTPLIVVGHGGQALFRNRPRTLRVRLVAPLATRVRLIRGRRLISDEDAARLAHRIDEDRQHFVREYFGADVRDPLLYHLVINTGLVGLTESVRMVARLVESRREDPPTSGDPMSSDPMSSDPMPRPIPDGR